MSDNKTWQPDWATHPGEHLAEYLEVRDLSQGEFARLAGLTPKLVSTIINGTNPVVPDTAIRLEHVLGLRADIWLALQKDWELHKARVREEEKASAAAAWLSQFPLRELKKLGHLPNVSENGALLSSLLDLLGIGSPNAYDARVRALAVHHRRSRRGVASREHEVCWLMLGEEQARKLDLPSFNEKLFVECCQEIRKLTIHDPALFEPRMRQLCADSGVALVFQKPISKTCLFGAARWVDGERPLIQMSLRMKSNDHFWWTFFHEAAHIILHRGKNFADDQNAEGDGIERQADKWAEETLVGSSRIETFAASKPQSKAALRAFADEVGIHPGIILGMLQHKKCIPYKTYMHDLKDRFEWADEVTR